MNRPFVAAIPSLKRDVCVAGSSVTSPVAALTMCLLLKYKAGSPSTMPMSV